MIFNETKIKGLWVIELEPRGDDRGYFVRNFAKEEFAAQGIEYEIVHINRSFSKLKGTTRGLHYEVPPKVGNKTIQCLQGRFFWAAVDIRKDSPTYGQFFSKELSADKKEMVLCPRGCANGIQVLEDDSELQYFMTQGYAPECERGIPWNDPYFHIDWPFKTPTVISDKDLKWPAVDPQNPPAVTL